MKLVVADLNWDLIKELGERLGSPYIKSPLSLYWGSIFDLKGVIVSASNFYYQMSGGLDAQINRRYFNECEEARKDPGVNQRIGNVIFTITVDENLNATPELVRNAVRFALDNVKKDETLLLSGLGTGIGSLNIETFCDILLEELSND